MDYEEYSPHWTTPVRQLADRVLGSGYFGKTSKIMREPETHMIICAEGNELVGFSHGRLLPKNSLGEFLENRVDIIPSELAEADISGTFGVIQSLVVSPKFRGQRVGTSLVSRIHDRLIGHGADKVIATFKQGPGSNNIEGIMRRMKFEFWLRLKTNFSERCDTGSFACPDRTTKCNCHAVFFRKTVF